MDRCDYCYEPGATEEVYIEYPVLGKLFSSRRPKVCSELCKNEVLKYDRLLIKWGSCLIWAEGVAALLIVVIALTLKYLPYSLVDPVFLILSLALIVIGISNYFVFIYHIHLYRGRMSPKSIKWFNQMISVLMIVFGILLFLSKLYIMVYS